MVPTDSVVIPGTWHVVAMLRTANILRLQGGSLVCYYERHFLNDTMLFSSLWEPGID